MRPLKAAIGNRSNTSTIASTATATVIRPIIVTWATLLDVI